MSNRQSADRTDDSGANRSQPNELLLAIKVLVTCWLMLFALTAHLVMLSLHVIVVVLQNSYELIYRSIMDAQEGNYIEQTITGPRMVTIYDDGDNYPSYESDEDTLIELPTMRSRIVTIYDDEDGYRSCESDEESSFFFHYIFDPVIIRSILNYNSNPASSFTTSSIQMTRSDQNCDPLNLTMKEVALLCDGEGHFLIGTTCAITVRSARETIDFRHGISLEWTAVPVNEPGAPPRAWKAEGREDLVVWYLSPDFDVQRIVGIFRYLGVSIVGEMTL
ncbi:hypothetical protein BJ138DRAFT_1119602 [Hygrophoropsis aurantiaca]|uniref:Uncharacterized protein n=1 Tax=Hygrophoropsis aurantiaca TaxID=72124 RepID=A0ACB7ZTN8_9AGAM|nr:hypothetical protein BJ138DRAFT_1119602 [Hygrophoropsis aurantiaca]